MSKQHLFAASLLIYLCLVLFAVSSCPVPFFEHPEPGHPEAGYDGLPEAPAGMGYFSLSIDTSPARTLLPEKPEIKTYELIFTRVAGNTSPEMDPIYRTEATKGDPVLLREGTWDLLVQAYTDTGDAVNSPTQLVANGSVENININGGALTTNTVTLKPLEAGNGTFSWTINYPAGVTITSAQMDIAPFSGGGAPVSPTVGIAGDSASGDTQLPAGYYRVNITLKSNNPPANTDEKTASLTRVLHILPNMVSEYHDFTFTASNFTAPLSGTVTITGTAALGETLTADTTDLGGTSGTIYYQWKRNGANIPGETNQTYTVKPYIGSSTDLDDIEITVEVYRAGYNGSITSDPVTVTGALITSDDDIPFIITGNTTDRFTATLKDIPIIEGAAIQTVINAIRDFANGEDCVIQFGDGGTNVLGIGNAGVSFDNTDGGWGVINLTGSINGALVTLRNVKVNSSAVIDMGTLSYGDSVTVSVDVDSELNIIEGGAVLSNRSSGGMNTRAINNSGTLNISGGTVSTSTNEYAIFNQSTGRITVSGGTVSSPSTTATVGTIGNTSYTGTGDWLTISGGVVQNTSSGNAIRNASTGGITISGGTVSATTGRAILSEGSGAITISQTDGATLITSANTTNTQGTIHLTGSGSLSISGGVVRNSVNGGTAIRNNTAGAITVSGGTVEVTVGTGTAIYNASTGAVTINSGTVSAIGGFAIYNISTGTVTVSGGTVSSNSYMAIASAGLSSIPGLITIRGTAMITSGSTDPARAAIVVGGDTGTDPRLVIEGGTVQNMASGGTAIRTTNNAISITGGTVQAGSGIAILSNGSGLVSISQTYPAVDTKISSANADPDQGTIHLAGGGDLSITGGTVENTSGVANSKAIHNTTAGTVTIAGGTVESTRPADAFAVYNAVETAALSIDFDNADIIGLVHPDSEFTVANRDGWNGVLTMISTGGVDKEYTIEVTGDINIEGGGNTFGNATDIEVTITGSGTLTFDTANSSSMFIINENQTLIIGETGSPGPTLQRLNNTGVGAVVVVRAGSVVELRSGKITGNVSTVNIGGVNVNGGTFIMSGGEISGNTGADAGGVAVWDGGIFIMNGGAIYNNIATRNTGAGGVLVQVDGEFKMTGGTIYGNDAPNNTDPSNALVNQGTAEAAQHGRFVGGVWQPVGDLASTNNDITVDDGVLQ